MQVPTIKPIIFSRRGWSWLPWLALCAGLALTPLAAQVSTITGSLNGRITDPSGAAVPGATVTVRNSATGQTETATSGATGQYRFALLQPGNYLVTFRAHGFKTVQRRVPISVGQSTSLNALLQVTTSTQTITVTSAAPVVQTQNGNISTNYTAQQIALVPNPGNDLSYIPQTSPGAVMNTQSGYGNFETFGLPGTSNLFTVDGENDNDPFLNLNNSGATNLLLGQNDMQEATVVNNGYSGQYGHLVGSNVNYVTKSGSNAWHGNAVYWWNGRVLNSNDFFNNATAQKRPFDNVNQWAWSIGGPIVKNHSFFFIDQEGLRVVLPTTAEVKIPSPAFQAATLSNIGSTNPAELPFYNQIFNLYNGAPGASKAVPLPGGDTGCGSFTTLGGAPCALQFRSTAGNFTHEWYLSGRYDQILGSSDHFFLRLQTDRGLQATYTDPINSAFNAVSNQPEYQGQFNETHTFGPATVNQFIGSFAYYSAIFQPKNLAAALATFPTTLSFSGGAFQTMGGALDVWPQGRNVTQYQIVDDVAHQMGAHSLKIGGNFLRDDVSDHDFGFFSSGSTAGAETLSDFYSGNASAFVKSFPSSLNEPVRLYSLGGYIQDGWSVTPGLRMTFSIRTDHNSNPVCLHDCFARLTTPFNRLAHDASVPYNRVIQTGLAQAFAGYDHWNWQPRFGFAWTPFGMKASTVLRGGVGLFDDTFPSFIVDSIAQNPPLDNTFVVAGVPLGPTTAANSMFGAAASANSTFLSGFASGQTVAQMMASNPAFTPPNFYTPGLVVRTPRFQEWNLELQQGFGADNAISINYVGNHGIHIPIANNGLNAYCPPPAGAGMPGCPAGFAGLPAAPPDARFGTVTQVQSMGVSNYNGVTVSLTRRFSAGFQLQANYTWSHALDDVSNGGLLPFNATTDASILSPQDPFNVKRYNYGNADYDVRHSGNLSYLWQVPFHSYVHWGPSQLWQGWVVAGTVFARTGLPFTVIDTADTGMLSSFNYGGTLFANWNGAPQSRCTVKNNYTQFPSNPCLPLSGFSAAAAGFGQQQRNQFRGPNFFDTDLSIIKNTQIPGWEQGQLGIGVTAFNLFNHPNMDLPVADIANSSFGQILIPVNPPTSILGSFLGGDASPRMIQLTARLTF